MKVIKPTTITSAMLVSTTATEAYSAWNAGTAYVLTDKVIYTTTERIYERLVAGTTATAPNLDTVNWLDIGPTNKWAMFDSEVSTQTSATTSLTAVVKPGYVNSLAFFGLEGASIDITERDGLAGPIVYTASKTLDGAIIADWYQYFFEPTVQLAEVVFTDVPPYSNGHITVVITGATSKCGIMLVGTFYGIGETQNGASASIIDYSRKETDPEFGTTTFVRRAYSKRMNASMFLDNTQINKVQRVLADLRATPCAWIGSDMTGMEPLTVFGFYRDFSINVAYGGTSGHSLCSLEIEGLT
jgi:hypothetical protein